MLAILGGTRLAGARFCRRCRRAILMDVRPIR